MTPYGETTIKEIYALVEKAGLSEGSAIAAATLNGAKMLRVDDITGSIESGKSADLIVTSGNPLEDIHAVSEDGIKMIMKGGLFVRKKENS